jgi:acyl-CoA thioesterase-1
VYVCVALAMTAGCGRDAQSVQLDPSAPAPAAVAAPSQAAEPTEAAGMPKVAFLGDSIAAGLHLPADEAFPAVLESRLRARNNAFTLVNAGVSGDTTAGGLRRVDWILQQRPDVVVIELGANDGLRGVALSSIEQNLRGIIEKVRAAGATPLLLGVRVPPSYGPEYAEGFDAIYPRLGAELEVKLVPFFMQGVAGVPAMNLEDGLHPTTAGHVRLAENVEPVLHELLAALQRR